VSGDQFEYSLMAAAGLFCTLVGVGRIDIGLPAKNRATMRWAGPVVLICGALLLALTFFQ
jgi:hypothetical protein